MEQFQRFARLVASEVTAAPQVERKGPAVWAAADGWVYVVDVAGNQVFRPTESCPRLATAPLESVPANADVGIVPNARRDEHIAETRRLAEQLVGLVPTTPAMLTLKREVLLVRGPSDADVQRYSGRFLVRLHDLPDQRYFQAMFGPDRRVLRIDTNVRFRAVEQLAASMRTALQTGAGRVSEPSSATGQGPVAQGPSGALSVGTFFDPDEHRFEITACSYEGEPFFGLTQRSNPFGRDHFDVRYSHLVDVAAYRRSLDYRYWCWHWWDLNGRANGIRGNWDARREAWEHAGVTIRHHRSLETYVLGGGEPKQTNQIRQPDGKTYAYPFVEFAEIEPRFYDELEECHVAFLLTHGGQWRGQYRFRRGLDVWVAFRPPGGRKLGSGSLRHLFLEGCAGMTRFKRGEAAHLLTSWLRPDLAGGIRTICGVDGEYVALDRNGWRFFGRYHKGDSISDAWALALIDECPRNDPVTVAFGPSRADVLQALLEGRFAQRRAGTGWIAVSVWVSVPVDAGATSRPPP